MPWFQDWDLLEQLANDWRLLTATTSLPVNADRNDIEDAYQQWRRAGTHALKALEPLLKAFWELRTRWELEKSLLPVILRSIAAWQAERNRRLAPNDKDDLIAEVYYDLSWIVIRLTGKWSTIGNRRHLLGWFGFVQEHIHSVVFRAADRLFGGPANLGDINPAGRKPAETIDEWFDRVIGPMIRKLANKSVSTAEREALVNEIEKIGRALGALPFVPDPYRKEHFTLRDLIDVLIQIMRDGSEANSLRQAAVRALKELVEGLRAGDPENDADWGQKLEMYRCTEGARIIDAIRECYAAYSATPQWVRCECGSSLIDLAIPTLEELAHWESDPDAPKALRDRCRSIVASHAATAAYLQLYKWAQLLDHDRYL